MNKLLFLIFILPLLLSGCRNELRFLVCPYEFADKVRFEKDLGLKRELLVGLNYRVVVVIKKDLTDKIVPVQHYRPEHTFGHKIHPINVSFEEPLTVSTILIVEDKINQLGIAINDKSDISWRVHWLQSKDFNTIQNNGLIFLPRYRELPIIEDSLMQP